MLRVVCCVLLVTLQLSRGEEEEEEEESNCYRGSQASTQLKDWITRSLQDCRLADGGNCQLEQFQDIQLARLDGGDGRSWYLTTSPGWSLKHRQFPRAPAFQGAFYYDEPAGERGGRRGVYLYPDWTSCVAGWWRDHLLEEGGYCSITQFCLSNTGLPRLTTARSTNTSLTYSPPSYSNTGLPPTIMDPFENNTVEVRKSQIPGASEGLFTTRPVSRGELVSFYSGLLTKCDYIIPHLHRRKPTSHREMMKIKMSVIFRPL